MAFRNWLSIDVFGRNPQPEIQDDISILLYTLALPPFLKDDLQLND